MVVYIDCIGGLAGDMLLGALLDAGADLQAVQAAVAAAAAAAGAEISIEPDRVTRHGISALRVKVDAPVGDSHRRWRDVRAILDASRLDGSAHAWAHDAFRRLAIAEADVHAVDPEQVHFHEVGALDAIADIVGVCVALASLAPDAVICSPLPVAGGIVDAAHGRLPLPAPATLQILSERGAPVVPADGAGELVTPTGAALAAVLAREFGPFPAMTPKAIGYGAGSRDPVERPNLVRVVAGPAFSPHGQAAGVLRSLSLVETNLDDLTPELVPDAFAAAFAAGAVDVWSTPAQMKKGRPGLVLSALARPADTEAVARSLLRHTTTFGVRIARVDRRELERDSVTVDAGDGPVRIKRGWLDGELIHAMPEHDDCADAARRNGLPVADVWARALGAAAVLGGEGVPGPAELGGEGAPGSGSGARA